MNWISYFLHFSLLYVVYSNIYFFSLLFELSREEFYWNPERIFNSCLKKGLLYFKRIFILSFLKIANHCIQSAINSLETFGVFFRCRDKVVLIVLQNRYRSYQNNHVMQLMDNRIFSAKIWAGPRFALSKHVLQRFHSKKTQSRHHVKLISSQCGT